MGDFDARRAERSVQGAGKHCGIGTVAVHAQAVGGNPYPATVVGKGKAFTGDGNRLRRGLIRILQHGAGVRAWPGAANPNRAAARAT